MLARNQITRRQEGQTIAIVAISIVALLAMAALAIDVVTLYVTHGEAQRAANAAALAGAKLFSSSGFTSSQFGPSAGIQDQVCTAAIQQAQATSDQNPAAQQSATLSANCIFNVDGNPQITVTARRTGLPTFFAKIWNVGANSVSATATAEAINSSGSAAATEVPIQVGSLKPFLIPNCVPIPSNPPPCTGKHLIHIGSRIAANQDQYIGRSISIPPAGSGTYPEYYILDLPQATSCPSTAAVSCGSVGTGKVVYDNIACANPVPLACGQTLANVDANSNNGTLTADVVGGTQCLIHDDGSGTAQDKINPDPAPASLPVTIDAGTKNPVFASGTPNISRSDSVITVPVFNPCTPGPGCIDPPATATIIGFLQLGIQSISPTGAITAVVMNVSSCNPGASDNPVSGGGVSPIPVRLIE